MYKILITGAGSAQTNGVVNCLLDDEEECEIIGVGSDPYDLMFCRAHKRYLIPHSTKPEYKEALLKVIETEKPDLVHFQHDVEMAIALKFEDEIRKRGCTLFAPDYQTIDTCVYKYKSWLKFKEAGIKVPENIVIETEEDLANAYKELTDGTWPVWFRPMIIGNAGKGSFVTGDQDEAKEIIDNENGWGNYMAAEYLPGENLTWLSIWKNGDLIVAQGRKRGGWAYSSMSLSGVTGITKIGETYSSDVLDDISIKCCKAVATDGKPNGIFGVDLKCDRNGVPNPTEINISRFFATVEFFEKAGLNMPAIFKDLALYNKKPSLERVLNPLEDGLLWLRSLDDRPILTTESEIKSRLINWRQL
jgi:carbamoyl-phosphate synthase large subunit